jgi:cell division septation protein DedD
MPDETVGAAHETAEAIGEDADAHAADAEAADAHDEAVLDMVALEMAAVDPFDIDDPSDIDEIEAAELPPEAPVVARQPEPPAPPAIAPSLQPSLQPSFQPSPQASPQASREASPEPSPEPSLGSTLIANGILRKPTISGPDPLAPIRRLSQAEKIAFFS